MEEPVSLYATDRFAHLNEGRADRDFNGKPGRNNDLLNEKAESPNWRQLLLNKPVKERWRPGEVLLRLLMAN